MHLKSEVNDCARIWANVHPDKNDLRLGSLARWEAKAFLITLSSHNLV
jgi:hypothetical protein